MIFFGWGWVSKLWLFAYISTSGCPRIIGAARRDCWRKSVRREYFPVSCVYLTVFLNRLVFLLIRRGRLAGTVDYYLVTSPACIKRAVVRRRDIYNVFAHSRVLYDAFSFNERRRNVGACPVARIFRRYYIYVPGRARVFR